MTSTEPIAVVGVSAVMPDAPDVATFWSNLKDGRYSISDVPTQRWDPALYYDPDPRAPDKTYSRIGAWVRSFTWAPLEWRLPVPPAVAAQMEEGQKWAVAGARAALLDAGWPDWPVDPERVAVVIGNAIGGEKHYRSNQRVEFAEVLKALRDGPTLAGLPAATRDAVLAETGATYLAGLPAITEDTMPGELANVIAGRVANVFNLRGPNFTADAACASGLAAMSAAVRGLQAGDFDAVVTGGIDRNMNAGAFVKFCKIGALSATGTRPFDAGADGFVMGEGAALFVLKRLADAERDGERVYAVLLGIGGASDGRGKGITAPNPIGQRLAVERAWQAASADPASASCVEAHGTSTRVGDATELASLGEVFRKAGAAPGTVALGSVKSNIGHLKGAAGAAGLLKTVLSLHDKVLVPSLHVVQPNQNVDWAESPFRVNTALRAWDVAPGTVRRAGVSAFGFGGTNFHAVVEEYIPGRYRAPDAARAFAGADVPVAQPLAQPVAQPVAQPAVHPVVQPIASATAYVAASAVAVSGPAGSASTGTPKVPLRGALVIGGEDEADVARQLRTVRDAATAGHAPAPAAPDPALARAALRVAIDYADAADLAAKAGRALTALDSGDPARWRMLRAQGVYTGRGAPGKVAFLFTGQGSQYVNMLRELRGREPIVAAAFAEADRVMAPLLDRPLSEYIFAEDADEQTVRRLSGQLMQTEITQPAVLATDLAMTRLLDAYGVRPDMVIGHSLGEYGALVAAGALSFPAALEAVSARGHEMASLSMPDNGAMAAVFAPLEQIEQVVAGTAGYVVVANVNSNHQAVIGGATDAVDRAVAAFTAAGVNASRIPVSHAFHTSIVAPAAAPLRDVLRRLDLRPPRLPVVANVTGDFYPPDADVEAMLDLLGQQVAAPVQFVRGLRALFAAGARVFVEVGPKKALHGFVEDVLGDEAVALFTNHPKIGDIASFNQALCGLYAAGLGYAEPVQGPEGATMTTDRYLELGHLFADVLERGMDIYGGRAQAPAAVGRPAPAELEPVVITGAALGLPGTPRVFDDGNLARILGGEQCIDTIPQRMRRAMVDRHITRLVKRPTGDPTFEPIDSEADVIKLAGRAGALDVVTEFGVDADRDAALDTTSRLAIGAGFDALRDAGIPLVLHYKTTTLGTRLPDRWGLPESMRDDTGVIFASAFPGFDNFARELDRFGVDRGRREQLVALEAVRARSADGTPGAIELDRRIRDLRELLRTEPYEFDRRFLFRCLSMGHSQFAELIGARGPNTQINAACASTTQATGLAEDWIRAGRCRRVVVVSADDATSDALLPWVASGFLASGAAATDDAVADAATPFDRRRHGMIVGMGAAAFVVESAEAARERGLQPICEVLGAVTANSAYHGTRLDVEHIGQVMTGLFAKSAAFGADPHRIAPSTVFVSHETYTPARGGSAAAEVNALRRVFGADADAVVVTNTKGFTGHAMGAGVEDVVAIKALETGLVPPVPNFKEPDPELGRLNLSTGGAYPVRHALRLAAGFGSQVALSLLRWTPLPDGRHRTPAELGYAYRVVEPATWQRWLAEAAGHASPVLEVVNRRLRIADVGTAPGTMPATPVLAQASTTVTVPAQGFAPVAAPAVAVLPPLVAVPVPLTAPVPPVSPVVAAPMTAGPQAVPVPSPAAVPVPEASADVVTGAVVGIVSELTGYPPDLLDVDLDLEADLGVDTVKQAEVFAAVRERFGVARDENLRLRDFPTLTHVIGWIHEQTADVPAPAPALASAPAPASAPAEAATLAAPAAVPVPEASADVVTGAVVGIVSELTGYPPDLLDVDLDLEADLGVDTVKQAEVFAAVRERFGVARDENLRLRDFPTLTHVIGWIHEQTADVPAPAPALASAPAEAAVTNVTAAEAANETANEAASETAADTEPEPLRTTVSVRGDLAATGAIPRRVPVPSLRPELTDCLPTGVELTAGTRVVVVPDTGGVGDALVARLAKLGVEVLTVEPEHTAEPLPEGPVHGVYWLPALDDEGPLDRLDAAGWRTALRQRVGGLFTLMRTLYEQSPFLVTATRLGGYHGYDPDGAICPMGGAVTGFAKAYHQERPETLVKAVDFPASRRTAMPAGVLVDETLRDAGCVEVGHAGDRRWGVGLADRPFPAETGDAPVPLGPDCVVLATGAAGSIVSAIVADLATAAGGGTFHLLDLTPAPDPRDPDLRRFAQDRDGLKASLAERLRDQGERPTPVLIERELARLERLFAALTAIQAVEAAGGRARYHSVDLTDPIAVEAVMARVRDEHSRVDLLVHAAGLEISHTVPDKEAAEFDLVFGVKADGLFNLLHAAGDLPLGTVVGFSSVAGRFGNVGQTDYSAANDLLCKVLGGLRRSRPGTRGLALDWTAWGGIGMATRGSIPKVMAAAGVELLPPEAGIAWLRRELAADTPPEAEVLVAGALGMMAGQPHPTGGVDPAALRATGPMIGRVRAVDVHDGLVVERTFDPAAHPFLNDHRIDGVPVLPGVMGMEYFAEAARVLLPGWQVVAVEGLDFRAPVKFYRDEPRTLTVSALLRPEGANVVAECRLTAERILPGEAAPRRTVHFTGAVRLAAQPLDAEHAPDGSELIEPDRVLGAADVYRLYFHGPAYQVVDGAWAQDGAVVARFHADLPAQTDTPTVAAPRLVELCFQAAGLSEAGQAGRLALPLHVDAVRLVHPEPAEETGLLAVARPDGGGGFNCVVRRADGTILLHVDGYRSVALPEPIAEEVGIPIRAALGTPEVDDEAHQQAGDRQSR